MYDDGEATTGVIEFTTLSPAPRVRVSSPISRSIKMSLGQSFALVLAHERRHLWQARQIRSNAGFPEP